MFDETQNSQTASLMRTCSVVETFRHIYLVFAVLFIHNRHFPTHELIKKNVIRFLTCIHKGYPPASFR